MDLHTKLVFAPGDLLRRVNGRSIAPPELPTFALGTDTQVTIESGDGAARDVAASRWVDRPPASSGIVADIHDDGLGVPVAARFYLPLFQRSGKALTLFYRSSTNPASLNTAVEREIHAVDPTLPVFGQSTMENLLAASTVRRKVVNGARQTRPVCIALHTCRCSSGSSLSASWASGRRASVSLPARFRVSFRRSTYGKRGMKWCAGS